MSTVKIVQFQAVPYEYGDDLFVLGDDGILRRAHIYADKNKPITWEIIPSPEEVV